MTIKEIKERYANYGNENGYNIANEKIEMKFKTYTYKDLGKCVVVIIKDIGGYGVVQLVQVETGKELLAPNRHRNAFTLDDSIDVAYEMYVDGN